MAKTLAQKIEAFIMFEQCWTGRRWFNLCGAMLAIGFGPNNFIERVYINRKLVYVKHL